MRCAFRWRTGWISEGGLESCYDVPCSCCVFFPVCLNHINLLIDWFCFPLFLVLPSCPLPPLSGKFGADVRCGCNFNRCFCYDHVDHSYSHVFLLPPISLSLSLFLSYHTWYQRDTYVTRVTWCSLSVISSLSFLIPPINMLLLRIDSIWTCWDLHKRFFDKGREDGGGEVYFFFLYLGGVELIQDFRRRIAGFSPEQFPGWRGVEGGRIRLRENHIYIDLNKCNVLLFRYWIVHHLFGAGAGGVVVVAFTCCWGVFCREGVFCRGGVSCGVD